MRARVVEAGEAAAAVVSGKPPEEGGSGRSECCWESPATLLSTQEASALCQPRRLWIGFISGDDTWLTGIYYPLAISDHRFRLQERSGWLLITASRNHQLPGFCRTWCYLRG